MLELCVFKTSCVGLHSPPTPLSSSWPSFRSKGTAGLVFVLFSHLRFLSLALALFIDLIDADGLPYSLGFGTCDSEREV